MIPFIYFMMLAGMVFAAGIAGAASSRNFLVLMLMVEVAITASTIAAIAIYYFSMNFDIFLVLIAIWAVISAELMAIIVFYRHMERLGISLDITKLSREGEK